MGQDPIITLAWALLIRETAANGSLNGDQITGHITMISATSSIRPGIADSLLIPNKLKDNDLKMLQVRGDMASYQKTHNKFMEFLETDTPQEAIRKITEDGLQGYIAWKIDQLKAKVTEQVMGEMGLTVDKLNAMEAGERAEIEEKIMREVQRRLEMMIEEGMKEGNKAKGDEANLAAPGADSGQTAPAEPLANQLPPLMAQESQNPKALEQMVGGALAGLFEEGGFAPTPSLTVSIDDRGQIRLGGDRSDLADIQAALDQDTATSGALRLFGAVTAGSAMLADPQETAETTLDAAEDQQAAYARLIAERNPRETTLRFDGSRIDQVSTRRIDRPAA